MKSRYRSNPKLLLQNSRIQGRGVFAVRRFRKGERIIEYVGEVISVEEEQQRYDDGTMARHHTFLFQIDDRWTIDATRRGNIARYINHSCDPNCEAVLEDGRIFIEAIRNIQPGVELTYDYSYEHDGEITPELKEFYFCACGSDNCRGTIILARDKG